VLGYLSSMSFYNHDWASTLLPDSPMPPDVTFVVREGDTVERFPGHRFLLATISSVFKAQFFGPAKDGKEEIEVADATIVGFAGLMKFLYLKPTEFWTFFVGRSFRELFQILYLANKYLIDSLTAKVTHLISEMEIAEDKIMETAHAAEEYSHFGNVSSILLQRTSNSMAKVIKDLESLKKFQSKLDPEDGDLFLKMIGLIQDQHVVPPVSCTQSECKNVPSASHCSTHLPKCGHGNKCENRPIRCEEHYFKCNYQGYCRHKPYSTLCSVHRKLTGN